MCLADEREKFDNCHLLGDVTSRVYTVGSGEDINQLLGELPEGGVLQLEYQDGAILNSVPYINQRVTIRGKGKYGPQLSCAEGLALAYFE